MTCPSINARVPSTPRTKVIRYVWLAISHFSGTSKPNNANNVRPLLSLTLKYQNVYAHLTVLTSTMAGALNAKNQIFGTLKPNSASGALKVSCTKKRADGACVRRADRTFQTEYVSIASLQNTGTIRTNRV